MVSGRGEVKGLVKEQLLLGRAVGSTQIKVLVTPISVVVLTAVQFAGLGGSVLAVDGGAKHDPSSSKMEVDGQGVAVVQPALPSQGSNTGGVGGGVGGDELMSR